MSQFYKVIVELNAESKIKVEELETLAMGQFKSTGVSAFSISEEEVDRILGNRSYCGGDIEPELIAEIETSLSSREKQNIDVYFEGERAKELAKNFEEFLKKNYIGFHTSKDDSNTDWNQEWRKQYKKIEITNQLSIVPSWEEKTSKENDLLLYPGMGFGTGSHETTYLCLKLFMESVYKKKSMGNVFDFGCGSGILGLATILKKWAKEVVFYDIDENALINTEQNILINEMESSNYKVNKDLNLFLNNRYDLVFANILENILLYEVEHIYELTATNGHVILSGLLNNQVASITDRYQSIGLELIKKESKGDWSAILLKKP